MTIVLQRFDETDTAEGCGGVGALKSKYGNLPLKQLSYHSSVVALAVRTTIYQTYYNPFDQPIEATYIFPIEGQTAVVACEMRVADRIVRAELKERSQARADYQRAIRSGHRAALLEENRPETFSMRVGNIPPGEAIQVCIETVAQLSIVHGEWTLRLPLVVAPRYTSGLPLPRCMVGGGTSNDTDQVPDASTVSPPTWLPGFASPVDLRLSVALQMGQLAGSQNWIESLKSSLHAIVLDTPSDNRSDPKQSFCRINILPGERVDRDFILRGKIDDLSIRTTLTVETCPSPTERTGHPQKITFAINIAPPRVSSQVPRDVVFLLDRSGSMNGWKMAAARRGVSRLIDSLLPTDRFQAIAFDSVLDEFCGEANRKRRKLELETKWHDGTDAKRYEATRWLSKIESRGGTEMGLAIEHGLSAYSNGHSALHTPRNLAMVLVTDGQITGEDSLLRLIGSIPERARPRLFCLGIDRAVNGSVLMRLAKLTGGTYELVESEKRLDEVLKRFADEIGSPVVTNLMVESPDQAALQLVPTNASTLYTGKSLTIYGQADPADSLSLKISGTLPNGDLWVDQVLAQHSASSNQVLLPLWGKSRVRELEDELGARGERDPELIREIIECSVHCSVLSRLTAFVAVDEAEVVAKGPKPHSMTQPSELPEGWSSHLVALDRSALISIPRAATLSNMTSNPSRMAQETSRKIAELLLKQNKISAEQLSDAESLSKQRGVSISDSLIQLQYTSDEDVARAVAEESGTSYLDVRTLKIDESVIQLVPESVARENEVLPIAASGTSLTVLVSDPYDSETIEKLRFILNRNIVAMIASASSINEAINHYYGQLEGESADSILQEFTDTQIDFTEILDGVASRGAGYDSVEWYSDCMSPPAQENLNTNSFAFNFAFDPGEDLLSRSQAAANQFSISEELPSDAPAGHFVNLIIYKADRVRASHVLLVPKEDRKDDDFIVLYFVDGKPIEYDSLPKRMLGAIITRIKILAKLNIGNRENLQSGTFQIFIDDKELELIVHVVGKEFLIEICAKDRSAETPAAVKEWWDLHKSK